MIAENYKAILIGATPSIIGGLTSVETSDWAFFWGGVIATISLIPIIDYKFGRDVEK